MEDLKNLLASSIKHRPTKISLRIITGESWDSSTAEVETAKMGEEPEKRAFERPISFAEFGKAVEEAFREAYGELKVVPISFREELLVNDHVMLRYVPTGSMGTFDIYIVYKDSNIPYRI